MQGARIFVHLQRDSYIGLSVALSNVKFFRMAKVKSAGLRNYVGKLGGNVYYMNKGQNISRELAPEVSNPRTPAQMRQRLKWANIVNVYKANKDWMGRLSFENKPEHWSYYNAFMSANIGKSPVYLTKPVAESGGGLLAPYLMTDGSLPSLTYTSTATGVYYTSLNIPNWQNDDTIGDLSADIIEHNGGWMEGDQLSIILMYRMQLGHFVVVPYEIEIDKSDTTDLTDIGGQFAALSDVIEMDDNMMQINARAGVQTFQTAICLVHSRTANGKTLVSKQAFELSVEAMLDYIEAGTDERFQDAYISYGLGEDYFLATPGVAISGGVGPAVVQEISRVAYGRSFYNSYQTIEWIDPPSGFPARIDIYMASNVEGQVSLTVGGVSLTPNVLGTLISTWVTSDQANTIDGAASANQKIRVTIGTQVYEWT